MAAAKISKEHGPQDPNGTADPGQTDPRTRPWTPDPTTAPEVLIMLPAANNQLRIVHTGNRGNSFILHYSFALQCKNTVRVATPNITLGALIY